VYLLIFFVNFFGNNYDWWTHTYCMKTRKWNQLLYINYPRHFVATVAMFNPLYSSMNQQLFERTSAATMNTTANFHYEWKPSCACHQIDIFRCEERYEWDTKKDTGKPMKNALYVKRYGKRHLSGWSDVVQQKNKAHSPSLTLEWRHQFKIL